jgi:signal transduction histidine kinase
MVIDVTAQRKLEEFLHKLAGKIRDTQARQAFCVSRELQDSIDLYHTALVVSLDLLVREREKVPSCWRNPLKCWINA